MTVPLFRALKDLVKRKLFRPLFEMLQRVGVNVTPAHFYSEIPNIAELRATESWRKPYDLSSLVVRDLSGQLKLLDEWLAPYLSGAREADVLDRAIASEGAEGFGPVEAYVLYCFVATLRPQRILQVGCGVSTSIVLQALEFEGSVPGDISRVKCVEPFPSEYLRELDRAGRIDLIVERAQDWDASGALEELGSGDLLFVDSTHTTVPGGDVNRIVLEWLPSLAAGTWVHFHDIYLPFDYAPGILTRNLFFTRESVLLQAFLSCNPWFRIELSLSMLHYERQREFKVLLGDLYRPRPMRYGLELKADGHFPSSTYLRRTESAKAARDAG